MQVTPGGWMYCHSYCNAPLVFLLPINKQSPSKVESSPFFCSVQFCCRSMQHSCCGHHYLRASKGFFCCFKLIRVEKWAARTQVSIARKKQMCSGLTSLSAHEQIRLCSCKVLLTVCRSYYFSPNLLPFLFFSFFSSPPPNSYQHLCYSGAQRLWEQIPLHRHPDLAPGKLPLVAKGCSMLPIVHWLLVL